MAEKPQKKERLKRVPLWEKKKKSAIRSKKYRKRMVNLRTSIDEWVQIREENDLENDHQVAELLITCYHKCRELGEDGQATEEDGPTERPAKRERRGSTSTSPLGHVSGKDPDFSSVSPSSDGKISPMMSNIVKIEAQESDSETSSEPESKEVLRDKGDITDSVRDNYDLNAHMTLGTTVNNVSRDGEPDPMYAVVQSNLMQLANLLPIFNCRTCGESLRIQKTVDGSAVVLNWVCETGHVTHIWASQPVL